MRTHTHTHAATCAPPLAQVHEHAEPYVRRATLLAAGQALSALPAPRLAVAMLAAAGGVGSSSRHADPMDTALVQQLEWLRGWLGRVQDTDVDASCAAMAGACRDLQAALAGEAALALGSGGAGALQAAGLMGAGSLVPSPGGLMGWGRQPVTLDGLQGGPQGMSLSRPAAAAVTVGDRGAHPLITELS